MNILILWAVFSGPALAQTPAVREFDAPSYVRAVLEASPELRQAEAGLEAAAAQAKEKFAALVLPTFGFTAESTPYGHAPSNSNLLTHWRLTRDETTSTTRLNLNLFNSFQDFRSARSARLNRDSSGAALSTAQGDRAFEAVRVFFDLGLKNRLLEVAAENLKAQEEQYRMTEDLYKNGMKSLSDLLKSETDWRSGELRLAAAQAAGKTALIRFNAHIDRAPLEAAVLKVDLAGATDLPRLEEDAVRARTARPELRKALLDLEIAEVSVRTAARRCCRPSRWTPFEPLRRRAPRLDLRAQPQLPPRAGPLDARRLQRRLPGLLLRRGPGRAAAAGRRRRPIGAAGPGGGARGLRPA